MANVANQITEEAIAAYVLAVRYTNAVMSKCRHLRWQEVSAMQDEHPSLTDIANAVAWCADAVEMAADKGLLPNGDLLQEARECEWKLRQIERAIATNDQSMLQDILRSSTH